MEPKCLSAEAKARPYLLPPAKPRAISVSFNFRHVRAPHASRASPSLSIYALDRGRELKLNLHIISNKALVRLVLFTLANGRRSSCNLERGLEDREKIAADIGFHARQLAAFFFRLTSLIAGVYGIYGPCVELRCDRVREICVFVGPRCLCGGGDVYGRSMRR